MELSRAYSMYTQSQTVPFRKVPFRKIPFRKIPFRKVPFRKIPFRKIPFRFVSFRFAKYRKPYNLLFVIFFRNLMPVRKDISSCGQYWRQYSILSSIRPFSLPELCLPMPAKEKEVWNFSLRQCIYVQTCCQNFSSVCTQAYHPLFVLRTCGR